MKVLRLTGVVGVAVAMILLPAVPAQADIGIFTSATMPSAVMVGQTGRPGSITIRNTNTPPESSEANVVTSIRMAPACGTTPQVGNLCAFPDPGVFSITGATGRAGTSCAGRTFTVSAPDASGIVTFTATGGPLVVPPPSGTPGANECTIDFTFSVLKLPTVDASPPDPGVQTRANVEVTMQGTITPAPVTGRPSVLLTVVRAPDEPPSDFDGDGDTDVSVYRPSNGLWYVQSPFSAVAWGIAGDVPVPGDYDGNGITEHAVFRPSTGTWYLRGPNPTSTVWGVAGDIPVPADYDGNGSTDVAVFRPSNGLWYVKTPFSVVQWGQAGDIPVPGDYDNNGTYEPAVYRPSNGTWYLRSATPTAAVWGVAGDIPVPGDYDGNGSTDIAVFRPNGGLWYVRSPFSVISGWGQPGDVPVPGDYNDDGIFEPAVFRPSNGTWYLRTPAPIITVWGQGGDIPTPLPHAVYRFFFGGA